jgi:DNA invertase Pin-like site-specific DNA recombinase
VAAYYRMSTLGQEDSIERQRSQVVPYAAKHGYTIVREYVDEGIGGGEIARRKSFQQMLRDAQSGAFTAILCDDRDRFGRFDSIDLGEIAAPLRRKGIWIHTVAQGKIDWGSFSGRITDAALQEAKKIESDATARRVLSNQLVAAEKGKHNGGYAPYGYRLEPHPVYVKHLVPDGHKAEVIRYIFRRYDEGATLGQIAEELYERGVRSPSGLPRWSRKVLRGHLTNRKYTGDLPWGGHTAGTYYRHGGNGALVEAAQQGERQTLPPSAWLVREQTHEALIDRELFARVQARLGASKQAWEDGRRTPHPGGGGFILTRLLVCGDCGNYLLGATRKGTHAFTCGSYIRYGKGSCNANRVDEATLVRLLIQKVQQLFLDPANLDQLRQEATRQEGELKGAENRARLERQLRALEEKIRRGEDHLLEVSKEAIPGITAALGRVRQQHQNVQDELKRIDTTQPTADLEKRIAEAEAALWSLREAIQEDDAMLLRRLLHELIDRVELHFAHTEKGGRTLSTLEHGVIYLRAQEDNNLLPQARGT